MRLLLSLACLAVLAVSAIEAQSCLFWTPWINADRPHTGKGDFETVGYNNPHERGGIGRVTKVLERRNIICNNPVRAECRARVGHQWLPWERAGDKTRFYGRINCDKTGLACLKSRQVDGKCADYEIRLLCWRSCRQLQWSKWWNKDRPSGQGDYEGPGMFDHPVRDGPACPDGGSPLEVQCQTTRGVAACLAGNPKIKCDVINGFTCVNKDQPNRRCLDYRVRYLCYRTRPTWQKRKSYPRPIYASGPPGVRKIGRIIELDRPGRRILPVKKVDIPSIALQ